MTVVCNNVHQCLPHRLRSICLHSLYPEVALVGAPQNHKQPLLFN